MNSALSQSTLANIEQSRNQLPTKKNSSIKTELEHNMSSERDEYINATEQSSTQIDVIDDPMDYMDEASVHPLAPAPQSSAMSGPDSPTTSQPHHSPYMPSVQPQQHQQLLKLKNEHGFPCPSPINTPDIVMTNDESDAPSPLGPSRRASSEANIGSNEIKESEDYRHNAHFHEKGRLIVDTTVQTSQSSSRTYTPNSSATPSSISQSVETPTTASSTAPSSRRQSLRTMPATLPRSALQEETIALFKQYRNHIKCAKCNSRNTIQRDGMSDGNLRFKCRPPVSMSLICNKSYSESKIRNMIAGVVYGNSLPDSNNPPPGPGDNVLALAPPSAMKSHRGSKSDSNENLHGGSEMTPEKLQQRLQQEDLQEREQVHDDRNLEGSYAIHPMDARRPSQSSHIQHHMHQQVSSSRRGSMQQHYQQDIRRSSIAGDEGMMMDYDDQNSPMLPQNHLHIPGTPPMESEDPRFYRSRGSYSQQGRAVTPTGPVQQPLPPHQSAGGRQLHKLHHSHSHPNIGQLRHQQYMEQQELQREHRGSISGAGYSAQQPQQPQRIQPRQPTRRDSSQYLGGNERRSSHPSPVLNVSGSKYANESHSPALSSSPRSSPGREQAHHQTKGHSSMQDLPGSTPTLRHANRYDESNSPGYFQRRMSQPHLTHPYNSSGHPGLPPPLPSPLSHPYDRRASEAEEYSQTHREKYERLNANTMLTPSSALGSSRQQQQKNRQHYLSGSPSGGMHPLDSPDIADESSPRQIMTPPMRSSHITGAFPTSTTSSPWLDGNGDHGATSQNATTPLSEPMRFSHSLPMNNQGPIAKIRLQGIKRKSLGQPLSRSNSYQNLYSHQNSQNSINPRNSESEHYSQKDLGSSMPCNDIKLTCYPKSTDNGISSAQLPVTKTLSTTEAMALRLDQSSKLIIEIRQPHSVQSYSPTSLNTRSAYESSSNALEKSSSSILGQRRSPSPDQSECEGSSSKKRRSDSDSVPSGGNSGSTTVSEDSAAAVVAAAAAAAAVSHTQTSHSNGPSVHVFGVDYIDKKENVGLGLSTSNLTSSPTIEALQVAKGSSYVMLEDQKEMGIDYSLFTRVETAGWRILIPPNVVASFRSEDFGLMLKPKGLEELDGRVESDDSQSQRKSKEDEPSNINKNDSKDLKEKEEEEEEEEDVNVEGVRRIALRDDKDEPRSVTIPKGEKQVVPEQSIQDDDQEMQEDEMKISSTAAVSEVAESEPTIEKINRSTRMINQEQGDVDMGREQDELLDDE
ncbi:hypothetical protein BGZ76_005373 [Entomortierella beljakovae]|nr:hypothetical protein BGZ76_005373 [Entomortierella beljakovae]